MRRPLTRTLAMDVIVRSGESACSCVLPQEYNLIDVALECGALRHVSLTGLQRRGDSMVLGLFNAGDAVRVLVKFTLWLRHGVTVVEATDQASSQVPGGE